MHAFTIVGYTADASAWHTGCVAEAYKLPVDWDNTGLRSKDSEGNDIHPIFADNDFEEDQVCSLCHEIVEV